MVRDIPPLRDDTRAICELNAKQKLFNLGSAWLNAGLARRM